MEIREALQRIEEIIRRGRVGTEEGLTKSSGGASGALLQDDPGFRYGFRYRSGKVTVYDGIQRSVAQCPVCGAYTNSGTITVVHEDGRQVQFGYMLFHDIEAGHQRGNMEKLTAIMADA